MPHWDETLTLTLTLALGVPVKLYIFYFSIILKNRNTANTEFMLEEFQRNINQVPTRIVINKLIENDKILRGLQFKSSFHEEKFWLILCPFFFFSAH